MYISKITSGLHPSMGELTSIHYKYYSINKLTIITCLFLNHCLKSFVIIQEDSDCSM